jgi:polysaccharide biosynthesis protein PslH
MKRRPRILYLSPCWPHAPTHGGQLRALHIGRALKEVGDVRLLTVATDDADEMTRRLTCEEFDWRGDIPAASLPDRSWRGRLGRALDPRIPHTNGLVAPNGATGLLGPLVAEADLVWFGRLRSASVFPRWSWPRSVVDIDDLPSAQAEAEALSAPGVRRMITAIFHRWVELRRQRLLPERFTVLAVTSEQDRAGLPPAAAVHVIPNGFERPLLEPHRRPAVPPRLGFIGLLDHEPNREGLAWFCRHCWPQISARMPGARLRLVGTGTDGPLRPTAAGIDGLGWLANPAAEMATWSALVVPIRTGGGTRIKILDGFSRMCPVISTTFGARGHDVAHGQELLLADSPRSFVQACVQVSLDPVGATAMADRAWRRFLHEWTWDAITPRVWSAAEDCLRRSGQAPAAPVLS